MNEPWQAIMVITVSYNLSEIEISHSMGSRECTQALEHLVFVVKLFQQLSHPLEEENRFAYNLSITPLIKNLK